MSSVARRSRRATLVSNNITRSTAEWSITSIDADGQMTKIEWTRVTRGGGDTRHDESRVQTRTLLSLILIRIRIRIPKYTYTGTFLVSLLTIFSLFSRCRARHTHVFIRSLQQYSFARSTYRAPQLPFIRSHNCSLLSEKS